MLSPDAQAKIRDRNTDFANHLMVVYLVAKPTRDGNDMVISKDVGLRKEISYGYCIKHNRWQHVLQVQQGTMPQEWRTASTTTMMMMVVDFNLNKSHETLTSIKSSFYVAMETDQLISFYSFKNNSE